MKRVLFTCAILIAASGCSKKFCEHEAAYQSDRQYAELTAPAGMDVPPADPNMRIPETTGDPEGTVSESRPCLELPPRMKNREQS